ncbi:MAG: YciI family protein [Kiloniellales bacterium]|nr:YciI family protein [Kiloniellales bacterium]
MLFAFYCLDKENHGHVRAENRNDHVSYLKSFGERVVTAGPLLSDDGESMIGSLIVLDLQSRDEAETIAANDPYAKADLFRSVEIRPWKKVI